MSLLFFSVFPFRSGTILGMYNLDKKMGNTDLLGRYFWRIESSDGKGAFEKCFSWVNSQIETNFMFWYYWRIRWDTRMACPCTIRQAFLDRGRFYRDWYFSWPEICFRSRRFFYFSYHGFGSQLCCYSTEWEDYGALKIGPPEGGHISVARYNTYYLPILKHTSFAVLKGFFAIYFTSIDHLIPANFTDHPPGVSTVVTLFETSFNCSRSSLAPKRANKRPSFLRQRNY